jgi:hypothetical protein
MSSWAADKRIAGFEESQQASDLVRNSDPHTSRDLRVSSNAAAEPKRTIRTQVNSIQRRVDLQRSCKPTGPSRQLKK